MARTGRPQLAPSSSSHSLSTPPPPAAPVDPALYANYGYGPQWQRQQQQHQQHQQQNPFAFQAPHSTQPPTYSPFQPQISQQPSFQQSQPPSAPFIQAPPQVYQAPNNLHYLAIPQLVPQQPQAAHMPNVPIAPAMKRPRQDNYHPPSQPRQSQHPPRMQPPGNMPPRPGLGTNHAHPGPKMGFPLPRGPTNPPMRGLPNAPRNRFPRSSGVSFPSNSRPGNLAGRVHGKSPLPGGNRRVAGHGFHGRRHGVPNKSEDDARAGGDKEQHARRDENRRSLTDFKVVGWCIPQIDWSWGVCKNFQLKSDEKVDGEKDGENGDSGSDIKSPPTDGVKPSTSMPKVPHEPPSRLRFYFHAPPDDVAKVSHLEASSSRGKRKKTDDDDDEQRERNIRQRQLSEAPSVEMGAEDTNSTLGGRGDRVSENDEGDWLMAAIGEESGPTTPLSRPDLDALGESADNSISIDEFGDASGRVTNAAAILGDEAMPEDPSVEYPPKEGRDEQDHSGVEIEDQRARVYPIVIGDQPYSEFALEACQAPESSVEQGLLPLSSEEMGNPSVETTSSETASLTVDNSADALLDDNQVGSTGKSHLDGPAIDSEPKGGEATAMHSPALSNNSHSSTLFGSSADTAPSNLLAKEDAENATPSGSHSSPSVSVQDTVSSNRLSILYAGSQRRLIVNAECVESVKLYRKDGRFEILMRLESQNDEFKGITIEGYSDELQSFLPQRFSQIESGATTPPLFRLGVPAIIKVVVFLDTEKPLSEPGWCKSGNIEEWLKREFGPSPPPGGWENRIEVIDPDPALTLSSIIDSWCLRGTIGTQDEREKFRKGQLDLPQSVLEVFLRLVKGDRPIPIGASRSGFTGPLLEASESAVLPSAQQTHVTMAVLSLANSFLDMAQRVTGTGGLQEGYRKISEIVQHLPVQQIHRVLDSMFRDWRTTKKKNV